MRFAPQASSPLNAIGINNSRQDEGNTVCDSVHSANAERCEDFRLPSHQYLTNRLAQDSRLSGVKNSANFKIKARKPPSESVWSEGWTVLISQFSVLQTIPTQQHPVTSSHGVGQNSILSRFKTMLISVLTREKKQRLEVVRVAQYLSLIHI